MLAAPEQHLLQPFPRFEIASRASVIAAVSGGSDSTALLLLLHRHLLADAPETKLVAVTVDHGLRAEAADEARSVAGLCLALGIAHRTLRWDGPHPKSGIAAAARAARYRLLAQAAKAAGTDLVFTGHTEDDQAETVLMRAARRSVGGLDGGFDGGLDGRLGRGLAGMARTALHGGDIWICRPLLNRTREELCGFLRGQGISWAEDPTNIDRRYERPRLRAGLRDDPDTRPDALRLAVAAADRRHALGLAAAGLISDLARQVSPGLVRLDPAVLDAEPEAAIYALRILLAVTGGTEMLPDIERTAALFERLCAGRVRAVLSRTLVDGRTAGIFLHRELRSLPAAAPTGEDWDGRFHIRPEAEDAVPGPVEPRQCAADAADVPGSLRRAALATLPPRAVGDATRGREARAVPVLAPWRTFLPDFDLAPATAAATLFGAGKIPPSPCRGHD